MSGNDMVFIVIRSFPWIMDIQRNLNRFARLKLLKTAHAFQSQMCRLCYFNGCLFLLEFFICSCVANCCTFCWRIWWRFSNAVHHLRHVGKKSLEKQRRKITGYINERSQVFNVLQFSNIFWSDGYLRERVSSMTLFDKKQIKWIMRWIRKWAQVEILR